MKYMFMIGEQRQQNGALEVRFASAAKLRPTDRAGTCDPYVLVLSAGGKRWTSLSKQPLRTSVSFLCSPRATA